MSTSRETWPKPGWSKRQGAVYFARLPNGAIRIGFTTRAPEVRLNEERASAGALRLLGHGAGFIADEGELHRRLSGVRLAGFGYRRSVYRASSAVLAEMCAVAGTRFRVVTSADQATHRIMGPTSEAP